MTTLALSQPRNRMAIYRQATRYQVALCAPDGQPALVLAYDAKRTRRALLSAMHRHGKEIIAAFPMLADTGAAWESKGQLWRLDHGYSVRFTGRTELDAWNEGIAQ